MRGPTRITIPEASSALGGRALAWASAIILGLLLPCSAGQRAEILDRVMAVVNGQPVTLSEVRGFVELGLVEAAGPDPLADALTELIDRRLMLTEVDRYPLPAPEAAAVDAALKTLVARFPTRAAFEAALARAGFTEARLRELVRDTLRLERYLAERFAAAAQPTEEETLEYYRAHQTAFTVEGRAVPFEVVREQVRERLAAERRQALIAEWRAELRRRADIVRLDRPEAPPPASVPPPAPPTPE
jgi:hypothetical protein